MGYKIKQLDTHLMKKWVSNNRGAAIVKIPIDMDVPMHYRFIILLLTLMAHTAVALENQFKVWAQYQYAGEFKTNPKIKKEFETQLRFSREGKNGLYTLLLREGLGYEIGPAVNILGGYEWDLFFKEVNHETTTSHENIIYEQASWSYSPALNFRTRLEQRQRQDQAVWNARWRIKAVSISQTDWFDKLQPMISDEVFLMLNHPEWVTQNTFDQNRLFVGFQIRMKETLWWQIGYMNQYVERNHQNGSTMNHILSLSLAYL